MIKFERIIQYDSCKKKNRISRRFRDFFNNQFHINKDIFFNVPQEDLIDL
jgi:hypothetical protein